MRALPGAKAGSRNQALLSGGLGALLNADGRGCVMWIPPTSALSWLSSDLGVPGAPQLSDLEQQRGGVLWNASAFCTKLTLSQTNGFGGASSKLILAQKKLKPQNFLYSSYARHTMGWLSTFITHSGLPLCYELVRQDSASLPVHLTPQTSDCFLQFRLRIPLPRAMQPPSATPWASFLTDSFCSSFTPAAFCVPLLPPSGHCLVSFLPVFNSPCPLSFCQLIPY